MKPSRYAPLEHPLVQQFQRAIDSLTAALAPASVRQYRAVARSFLIYLGEQHPAIGSLNQLRRDPHILGWFVDLRSQNLARRYTSLACCFCAAFCKSLPGVRRSPIWPI